MNVAQHVERGGRHFPDRVAVRFGGDSLTYAQLDRWASRLAEQLQQIGVQAGERIALYLTNRPEFIVGYLAAQKCGAVAVSLNCYWKRDEVRFALADSEARAVIVDDSLRPNIDQAELPRLQGILLAEAVIELQALASKQTSAPKMSGADPAAIVYTSGTTGTPLGCVLSHANVLTNIRAKVECLGIQPTDRLLLFVPLFHCFGQNAIMNAAFAAGATIVLEPRFDPATLVRLVKAEAPTMFFGPPTAYSLLLGHVAPLDLRPIRYFFSAAAPMPSSVALRWRTEFGQPIHEGYGLTETSPFATYNHSKQYRPGSVGTPIPNVEIRIVEPQTGSALPTGCIGEVAIRGPNVMLGYWRRPDLTREVIRDGWFHTGDLGSLDADGYLFLTDRLKEMINVAAFKVFPGEVEATLRHHPAVQAAAVHALKDPIFGEQVAATVVLHPGASATTAELSHFCRDRLADYKVPTLIRFVDAIPVNPTGKILRRLLTG